MTTKLITGALVGFILFLVGIAIIGKLVVALLPAIIIGVIVLVAYRAWIGRNDEADDED